MEIPADLTLRTSRSHVPDVIRFNMDYYTHWECEKCGEDIYSLSCNGVEYKEIPVFDLDHMSQTMLTCGSCGYIQGTGDIDVLGEDDF